LGYILRDNGHSLVPEPPERMMGINLWSRFCCEAITVAVAPIGFYYKLICQVKTGAMSQETSRSEQVIEGYKKHKLATSALARIHELIQSFERDRVADRRLAVIGLLSILMLIGISSYFLLSSDSLILP
jgi:hypothetical protein